MFSKMKSKLKDYFISEQQNDYVYYPTEDGIFAYYNLVSADNDPMNDELESDITK